MDKRNKYQASNGYLEYLYACEKGRFLCDKLNKQAQRFISNKNNNNNSENNDTIINIDNEYNSNHKIDISTIVITNDRHNDDSILVDFIVDDKKSLKRTSYDIDKHTHSYIHPITIHHTPDRVDVLGERRDREEGISVDNNKRRDTGNRSLDGVYDNRKSQMEDEQREEEELGEASGESDREEGGTRIDISYNTCMNNIFKDNDTLEQLIVDQTTYEDRTRLLFSSYYMNKHIHNHRDDISHIYDALYSTDRPTYNERLNSILEEIMGEYRRDTMHISNMIQVSIEDVRAAVGKTIGDNWLKYSFIDLLNTYF